MAEQPNDLVSTPMGPGLDGERGAPTRPGEMGPVPSTPPPPTVEGFDEDDD